LFCSVVLVAAGVRPAPALEGEYESAVTRIPCKLTERLSSQDARSGDRFGFDTTSSAQINAVFLPAGTHGHGVVVEAESARGPRPGTLSLEVRSLDLPDGKAIAVGLDPGQLDRRVSHAGALTAGTGSIVIGPVHDTNVVYEKGTAFVVTAPPPATPAPEPS
jgi:hypothetical protein